MITNIQSMINKFVWKNKTARINTEIMQQSMCKGGLGVSNMLKYYQAVQLMALLN